MQPVAAKLVDIEFPLFEEATQTASRFLGIPICFVGILTPHTLVLKAAVGLSQLGLMNPLARTRRLELEDSLVKAVLETPQSLVLPHINDRDPYSQSTLVQEYGIQSYLSVPLLTAEGVCLGLLAAMDVQPHEFSAEAIAFMELLARWSISEYERQQLLAEQQLSEGPSGSVTVSAPSPAAPAPASGSLLDTVRITLMSQLTQDMRNPLTTITGMANMLSLEIYGTLTPKQREYTDIVRNSSQNLLEIANEVLELSSLDAQLQPLHPTSVDVDMVGQHVQRMLLPLIEKKNQEIHFTVEPGSRQWSLDRDVVRQLLYHLLFSIVQISGEGGTVRIHCAERDNSLNFKVWMTHPWLGEGLPNTIAVLHQRLSNPAAEAELLSVLLAQATGKSDLEASDPAQLPEFQRHPEVVQSRETLSLLLSRHLVEHHGGTLLLQGSAESGYRFIISLPFLGTVKRN